MFDEITSAGPRRGRRTANSMLVSVLLHGAVIGLAAVATYVKAHAPVKEEPVAVTFRTAPPPPPPPPPPAPREPQAEDPAHHSEDADAQDASPDDGTAEGSPEGGGETTGERSGYTRRIR